jgi:hypothetical protein
MENDLLLPTRLSTMRRLAGAWVRRTEFAIHQVAFDLSAPIRLAFSGLDNYTPLLLAGGQIVQFNIASEARSEIYTSVTPWPHLREVMSMESKTEKEFRLLCIHITNSVASRFNRESFLSFHFCHCQHTFENST